MKTIIELFIISIFLVLSSCQKVINVDLNSVAPQIVIEGNVSDQPGPYTVKLSETVNFSDANTFPAVSGAIVKITDNAGTTETLTETSPGSYLTSSLQGVVGGSYTLSVSAKGKDYSASSTMPAPVTIDTLSVITTIGGGFGGGGGGGGGSRTNKRIEVKFQDPPTITNFYRFGLLHYIIVNHVVQGVIEQKNISITSDRFKDGTIITYNLSNGDDKFNSGDSVVVSLQSIDENVYTYFRTLNQTANNAQSTTPVNPISNLSNGALGYFSAYSTRSKSIIIP